MTTARDDLPEASQTAPAVGIRLDRNVRPCVAWRYTDARGHFRYRGPRVGFDTEYGILKPEPLYSQADLDAAVAAMREKCAQIVDPGDMEAWEARGGQEGIDLMRDLAAAIRGA